MWRTFCKYVDTFARLQNFFSPNSYKMKLRMITFWEIFETIVLIFLVQAIILRPVQGIPINETLKGKDYLNI